MERSGSGGIALAWDKVAILEQGGYIGYKQSHGRVMESLAVFMQTCRRVRKREQAPNATNTRESTIGSAVNNLRQLEDGVTHICMHVYI